MLNHLVENVSHIMPVMVSLYDAGFYWFIYDLLNLTKPVSS